ncbi:MAG: hypothetical protein UU21_C0001G0110 [Candidatus Levybacteria bacterium GW2011_GWA2_40_8]|nr:MAG: hypothetical protein UU21_C0001G0110 [Candidatus Levybacteria bacterium GW2011_GWA2_40_8]
MNAWVFDIDGVLTPLRIESIENNSVLQQILTIMHKEPVALITGRGLAWVRKNILSKFTVDDKAFNNLFISTEFGGEVLSFEEGVENYIIDEKLKLSTNILNKADGILTNYSNLLVREPKLMLYTAKIKKGVPYKKFQKAKKEILSDFENLIINAGLQSSFTVHEDNLAVNIKNKKLDKGSAINKFLKWLNAENINIGNFIVFGDNESDFEMGKELSIQGKNFTFVYVGETDPGERDFKVVRTNKHYDEGTLEYLRGNQ